jgi:uncharacterized repeat protein (TIGR04076 family)
LAMDPGIGFQIRATITEVKGDCSAGHRPGESFEISCYDSGGLCGFFYHNIFPNLMTFQFGGSLPWWDGDVITLQCPDSYNLVTIQLERLPRNE